MEEGFAKEKRRYARVPATFKVSYAVEGAKAKGTKECLTRNIGEGGILLSISEAVAISANLELNIVCPLRAEPIKAKGRVVWIQEMKKDELYALGLSFTHITEEDADFIRKYVQSVSIDRIFAYAVKNNASDIHIVSGQPPILRVHGELLPLDQKPLSPDEAKSMVYGILSSRQIEEFERELELDVAYTSDVGRFRANIHQEKGQIGATFRYIPTKVKSREELGLPKEIDALARQTSGLILVTGPTGSGKSTTLAAMIELINKERKCMVISLEDPIEYLFEPKKSVVRQREIGFDARSFINALKHTLRQDVNVIMVGEMRDLESISIAITAAETGHLVLTTLHTAGAVASINRIIDVFPADQQQQIRLQLSQLLRGVISQILLPKKDGSGRIAATEVMITTPAIANLIREGNTEQMQTYIATGGQYGMHLMDASLENLYKSDIISREVALPYVKDLPRFPK